MTFDFSGRVALVTGAATGIGAATAQALASSGASVGLVGLQPDALAAVEKAIVAAGGRALSVAADVADPAQIEKAVNEVVTTLGGLDLAVNNAGVAARHSLVHETAFEDWRATLAVNLDGVFLSMKYELAHMVAQQRGAIVNVASVNTITPLPRGGAYTASKHAVLGLTESAALDYAATGIRLNVVSPGVTDTPMVAAGGAAATMAKSLVPMGRMARPEEIAAAILFALSDDASYLQGSHIVVDGAFVLR
ncbi:SDR family NAD(P)-dependent oxidoreductase [Dactylosporangium sp. NPDC005572]|uniref:SDR family NAD(P)-dependent oxidoreductase n=1 Tax=Dactylosporangium sp. NPDC005572 TaxID=3156889 RepID=UPI0033A7530D